jgi:transposase InsO family protein
MEVITSDLTYVNVSGRWHYICLMINLFNREIVGYSSGANKDASLVVKAFSNIKESLKQTKLFHSDRGMEFKNYEIEKILKENDIKRSLSIKGCPFDNAVSESTYKIIKTEFAYDKKFISQEDLDIELFDYVNWYNNKRLHGTLGYMSPKEFRELSLEKLSK